MWYIFILQMGNWPAFYRVVEWSQLTDALLPNHFFFFGCGPFLKSLLNFLQYCFCFMFWFFGPEACGILAPRPGIGPAPPTLEGEVLTTGPLGKSPSHILIVCLFVCLSEKCSWSAMKQGRETNSRALIQEMTTKGKKQVSGTEWCSFSLCPIPTNQKRLRKDAKPQIPSDLKKQTKRTRIQSWENSWKHLVECSIYSHRQGLNLCTGRATEARSQSESPTCAEFRLWGAGSQGRACPWLGGGDPTPQLGRNEVRKESLSSFCHCL